ncbi:hypothetical protein H9Y04_32360 [Streptomyces sp. TRM66268-LWL]|uniref:Integral membrane protein n=1 Tax=Streptomyces polyasparticus TaxID=2767826 RepID=A0ABR7SP22_9ACTN|nr:hypothetical protein [Streptomyces polyasparticus]MBC9717232.1 hypothetical protein [Streptomyces polyasparticus]
MHPVARVAQILFLLGGLGMFAFAFEEAHTSRNATFDFRYECTTVNTGTTERPVPKETCEATNGVVGYTEDSEPLIAGLGGVGLMIGAVAVSLGSARRSPAPLPPQQPYGNPAYPAPPGQAPAGAPQGY